jgi:hypothetical protein
MKNSYLILLTLFGTFALNLASAQTPAAKISGTITDDAKKPVDGATVILLAAKDSVVVKTELSNADGSFTFQNLKDNTYIIKVTCMGYKSYRSDVVTVSQQKPVNLPAMILSATSKTLAEVGVTAQKSYVEQRIDRTVVNVNALISNNGANALEALEKTPGVLVDQDGNITYKGKTGVMIMIDDKPTYLSAANLTTYLRSMQASSLDQIELMDNPPAKYDAAGNAGVINIKTKKNTLRGFNASVSASVGSGYYFGRNVQSINMNYRVDKVNLFANISQNYSRTFRRLEIDRNFYDANNNQIGLFKDFSYFRPENYNTNIKTGLDYYLSPNTTWGVVLTGNYSPGHDNSPVNSYIYDKAGALDSLVNTNNTSHNTFKSGGVNLNYSHKFGNTGRVLTFDMDYIRDVSGSDQTFENDTYLPNGALTSSQTLVENTPSYINIYAAKSDFSMPLKHKGKFEAGVKSSYVSTDNAANYFNLISGALVPDYNSTNRFLYKENINAAYANYNQGFGRISVQAGLRVENTNGDGHQLGNALQKDSAFMRHYTNLFPTAYFSYKLDTAGHNVMVLSYGRRVGRPGYGNLNPFIFFIDKFSRFQGNPLLNPQFTDNYKVAYSYKSFFTVALVYNYTNGYQTETINQIGDIFISTQGNIGTRKSIDLSVNSNLTPVKWWTMNLYAEVFRNSFTGPLYNTELNSTGTAFSGNMNNQFVLGKGWSAELSGNYRTSVVNAQFHVVATGQLNAGLQKKVLNNKGTIRLSCNDIFHTFLSAGNIYYTNGSVSPFRNFLDTRVTNLGFTYSFGKTFNDHQKRETGSADTEQGRAH